MAVTWEFGGGISRGASGRIARLDALGRATAGARWQGKDIAPGTGERESWDELVLPSRLLDALRRLNPTVPARVPASRPLAEIASPDVAATPSPRTTASTTSWSTATAAQLDRPRRHRAQPDHPSRQRPTRPTTTGSPSTRSPSARGDVERRFDIVLYCNGLPVSIIELKKAGSADRRRRRPRTPSCRPTCASSRWRSGSRCSPSRGRGHREVRHAVHPAQPLLAVERRRRRRAARRSARHRGLDDLGTGLDQLIDGVFNQDRFLQLHAQLHRVRRGRRRAGEADRQAAPVLRRQQGASARPSQAVESQRQGRRRLAHAGLRQVDGDGALHPLRAAPPEAAQPDRSSSSPTAPSSTASSSTAFQPEPAARRGARSRSPRAPSCARELTERDDRRHLLHHPAEVRPVSKEEKDAGDEPPAAVRPPQHHRHRRRGPPQPLRRPRRLRPPPERRPAERDPHRLHRHADLLRRPQHPSRVRRLHRHLRPHPGRRRRRHGAGVLRAAPHQGAASPRASTEDDARRRPPTSSPPGLDDAERDTHRAQRRRRQRRLRRPAAASQTLAADLVAHWENRRARDGASSSTAPGKALIVGGTREICAKLYDAIVALRPDWHSDELDKGRIKVVYSGDPTDAPPVSQPRAPRRRRTRRSRRGSRTPTTSSRSSSSRT